MEKVLITDNKCSKTALVTGISGFVGSHLVDYLQKNHPEVEIHGIIRWRSDVSKINNVTLHYADLNDFSSLYDVLYRVKPDKIFHLAAQSYVDFSFKAPADTLHTNVIGTCNLLEAILKVRKETQCDPVIHICSSSEVYGQVKEGELPITEENQFRPASPYAVSKTGEDMLALQYFLSWGLKTIRSRSFTHTGPGRGEVFALSSFARQIAMIELGIKEEPVINVGNLDSVRTLCDVRDMAEAYWLLTEKGVPGEVYNIGGEEHMTIGEALKLLIGFSDKEISVKVDEIRLRPSDVTMQIPCSDKFQKATGWKPTISANQTLLDMLNDWRKILKESKDRK